MDVIYSTRLFTLLFDSAHRKLVFHLVGRTEWIQSVERKLAMKRRYPERGSVLFGDVLDTRNTKIFFVLSAPRGILRLSKQFRFRHLVLFLSYVNRPQQCRIFSLKFLVRPELFVSFSSGVGRL